MFVVDCQGHVGGIMMLWRNKDEVNLQTYNNNHVDVIVTVHDWNQYRLTWLYMEPNRVG